MKRRQKRILAGAAAGFIGGVVGAFAMNQFQALVSEVQKKQQERHPKPQAEQSQADSDDATMKAAEKLSRDVFHHSLSKSEKQRLGPLVHYAFGAAMGTFYGALAAVLPATTSGFGTAFGTALFALADETAVPALGLSNPPTEYPLSSHAKALASHLVWGATTEAVRRIAA
jgi:putative membrane protein